MQAKAASAFRRVCSQTQATVCGTLAPSRRSERSGGGRNGRYSGRGEGRRCGESGLGGLYLLPPRVVKQTCMEAGTKASACVAGGGGAPESPQGGQPAAEKAARQPRKLPALPRLPVTDGEGPRQPLTRVPDLMFPTKPRNDESVSIYFPPQSVCYSKCAQKICAHMCQYGPNTQTQPGQKVTRLSEVHLRLSCYLNCSSELPGGILIVNQPMDKHPEAPTLGRVPLWQPTQLYRAGVGWGVVSLLVRWDSITDSPLWREDRRDRQGPYGRQLELQAGHLQLGATSGPNFMLWRYRRGPVCMGGGGRKVGKREGDHETPAMAPHLCL